MSPERFIENFVELYRKARIPTFGAASVTRARCRPVSNELEDLIAAYVVANLPEQFHVYVDQYVRLEGRRCTYPDLVLLNQKTQCITCLVEIKTDLGFQLDKLSEACQKLRRTADYIAGHNILLGERSTNQRSFAVSPRVTCHLIIAALGKSGSLAALGVEAMREEFGVRIYAFSENRHPNNFSHTAGNDFPDLDIRVGDMRDFLEKIQAA